MRVKKENVVVEWVRLGEGLCGDYNEKDPNDIELLRFDVLEMDGPDIGEQISDASYCTLMPASTNKALLRKALYYILDKVYDDVVCGRSIKKKCEQLSWICPDWFKGPSKSGKNRK